MHFLLKILIIFCTCSFFFHFYLFIFAHVLSCLNFNFFIYSKGFPDSSVGKESACNAGDPSLIPGWGRSTGDGIGYPKQALSGPCEDIAG